MYLVLSLETAAAVVVVGTGITRLVLRLQCLLAGREQDVRLVEVTVTVLNLLTA